MMEREFSYPTPERIVEYNVFILSILKMKKADAHQVLSMTKVREAVEECQNAQGDIYLKAAVLLKSLVKKHAFASGNRRTALVAAKAFALENGGKFAIPDDPANANPMQGVREDYYTLDEIKEWIQHGKIRPFRR